MNEQLILLRRREIAGTLAVVAWALGFFIVFLVSPYTQSNIGPLIGLAMTIGYISTICWIAFDAHARGVGVRGGMGPSGWVVFAIFLLPIVLLIYVLSRPHSAVICSQCGAALTTPSPTCPNCRRQVSAVNRAFARLTDSLAPGSIDRARRTAKNMALTFIVLVFAEWLIHDALPSWLRGYGGFLAAISFAAYWVLVPWWVYLDASYRRMEGVPWALLSLLTNVFGLVTYLVIRYPDPGACRSCGAYLTAGQKHCPYCGSEAGVACPQCKAAIKAEWAYCPVCATQLSAPVAQPKREPVPNCIEGIVTDASTGSPIAGAQVRVDSKTDGLKAETDECGRYRLENLEARPYVLIASASGFEDGTCAYQPGMAEVNFALRALSGG